MPDRPLVTITVYCHACGWNGPIQCVRSKVVDDKHCGVLGRRLCLCPDCDSQNEVQLCPKKE